MASRREPVDRLWLRVRISVSLTLTIVDGLLPRVDAFAWGIRPARDIRTQQGGVVFSMPETVKHLNRRVGIHTA